ncbi:MAG TPA: acetyl-CoA carboxylase biotin carboxyl carrier protein [Peptococcaceae bacterium]|nr:acetyl-CoA carboxylase biotin carboxyl carrier protein [Peptococcaceae bacterium]
MNFKEIQDLIKILDESSLTYLELEQDGLKIILKKESEKAAVKEQTSVSPLSSPEQIISTGSGGGQEAGEQQLEGEVIKSPLVGTFYAGPAPGAEPFVKVGSKVKKGDTLCIIEAMKLMNEIEAEQDLVILDIFVQDGQMVEYGQPLFCTSQA